MISQRNPLHEIPDTMTSASAPSISPPYLIAILLPAPLPAAPCRPTGRIEARRHPSRYSSRLPVSSACHHLTHRPISSAHTFRPLPVRLVPPPAVARSPSSYAAHPSHPPRLISSGLSPVPPRFPLCCFPPSVPPHLFARLASSHRFISSHAPSDKMSGELTKRRTGRAIDNEEAERHDIRRLPDTANTPSRPPYSPYEPHNAPTPTRTRPR